MGGEEEGEEGCIANANAALVERENRDSSSESKATPSNSWSNQLITSNILATVELCNIDKAYKATPTFRFDKSMVPCLPACRDMEGGVFVELGQS